MKIYFELEHKEKWHKLEWLSLLEQASAFNTSLCAIVDSSRNADVIILTEEPRINMYELLTPLRKSNLPIFIWDDSDQPTGRFDGFYCSLPRTLFDHQRHRSFFYPLTYNERIEHFPLEDASYDYGFMGGITAPLRRRILEHLSSEKTLLGNVRIQGGPWDRMFDRSGVSSKLEYAENIRRSKFIICPRGNGVGSVRLFEAMKAGRIPIIISDQYVLPYGIDWQKCSITVKERDLSSLQELVRRFLPNWQTMARDARETWEKCFSTPSLTAQLSKAIQEINKKRTYSVSQQLKYLSGQIRTQSGRTLRRLARHFY